MIGEQPISSMQTQIFKFSVEVLSSEFLLNIESLCVYLLLAKWNQTLGLVAVVKDLQLDKPMVVFLLRFSSYEIHSNVFQVI